MTISSSSLTRLDRGLLRCIQLAPRAPFSLIAQVLGVSEQTVARRFRTLRDQQVVSVAAVTRTEAVGQTHWIVRARCKPRGGESLARALAKRPDVGWVSVYGGGSVGVVCSLRARTDDVRDELLFDLLPSTPTVLDVNAAMTLHTFAAARPDPLPNHGLSHEQEATMLACDAIGTVDRDDIGMTWPEPAEARTHLEPVDWLILRELARDGRASLVALGQAADISAGQVRRHLLTLLNRGVVYFDVDIAPAVATEVAAHLWMTVSPADLSACGEQVAALPQSSYVAALTGSQNLLAVVRCPTGADLYHFMAEGIGSVPGINALEVSVHLQTLKQSAPIAA